MRLNFKAFNDNLSYQWTAILVCKGRLLIDKENFDKLDQAMETIQKFNDSMIEQNKGKEILEI